MWRLTLTILLIAIGAGVLALVFALILALNIRKQEEGDETVRFIGNAIKEGGNAFLSREYRMLAIFVVLVFIALALLIDYDVTGRVDIAGDRTVPSTAIAYLVGALGSALTGFLGMSIAVRANTRTAVKAQSGLNAALRVAFNSGTVMGVSVVGIGLIGVTVMYWIFQDITIVAGFGFGASSIALFARVGGGIYTKAADVGADLVGKVEQGMPEDDPRNPATVADNVGDNVGDVAGMGADLFESYVGSIIATIALAAVGAAALGMAKPGDFDADLFLLPILVAAIGIFSSIIGTFLVRTKEGANMGKLLWALRTGIIAAGILVVVGVGAAVSPGFLDLDYKLFWVVVVGLVAGQIIGTASEVFTSYEFKFTRDLSKQAATGPATVIIGGLGLGMLSTVVPGVVIVIAMWMAHWLADTYGVALAAVGMLSTLGITLATDAYGPVADNAGGIAEQAGLDPEVRKRTDALDSLGNTTAATGKGFAIGSAVLTALALMAAYSEVSGVKTFDLLEVNVLMGLIVGALMPFLFAALTMQAVGRAAMAMVEEVRQAVPGGQGTPRGNGIRRLHAGGRHQHKGRDARDGAARRSGGCRSGGRRHDPWPRGPGRPT